MKKYFTVFLLGSAMAGAADFINGQAARAIFGQINFTQQDEQAPCQDGNTVGCFPSNGVTPYIMGAAGGVAYANNTLFVADNNREGALPQYERVIVYTNISQGLTTPTQQINQYPGSNFVQCPVCVGTTDTPLNTKVLGGGYPGNNPPDYVDYGTSSTEFRTPTAVASDGNILVVADTDNNRILIWQSVAALTAPTAPPTGLPADIVLGQPDMNTVNVATTTASSFRGPQGVWIQGTQLFVADTQNDRILIWNNIPTTNNQPADLVLGAPNFTTQPLQDVTTIVPPATASNMLSPTSVTSDGTRLFVSDLGQNRVLIWNSIPTQNNQPADVEIGQVNMTQAISDNAFTGTAASSSTDSTDKETAVMCTVPSGTDPYANPTFPNLCEYTLSLPRFALSDGQHLYIADGGNDRILIYNTIPTQNATPADIVLGQPDMISNNTTDSTDTFRPDANILHAAANTIRTPTALAWDGTNLYATDPFDMRVMVFTPATPMVPITGIVNAASLNVNAVASVTVAGTITAGDMLTISIGAPSATTPTNYTYTVVKDDTIESIVAALANLINAAPDPNVIAIAQTAIDEVVLTSRIPGANGNNITLATTTAGVGSNSTTTTNTTESLTASGSTLSGGGSAAEIAPGTIVSINADTANGQTLADAQVSAPSNAQTLPTTLGGVQVYLDGLLAPIFSVGPTQINVQMPFEVAETSSVSAVVRIQHSNGTVAVSDAIGIPIVGENPGIYASPGNEPRPVIAYHASSNAIAVVDIEGTPTSGDTATILIDNRSYAYAVQATDTSLDEIRDGLIALISANPDERVVATAAGQFDRIVLTAKIPGPLGNGIPVSTSEASVNTAGALVTLTALQPATCCASVAGALVTPDNPAVPGELITIYATGLGVVGPDNAKNVATTGSIYPLNGPPNTPDAPVDNAQVGGSTANVLYSGLEPGAIGLYKVELQLDQSLTTNLDTQMYIAQNVFTSNIVTIPVVSPTPLPTTSTTVPSALSVVKSHTGDFTQGQQNATYQVVVSNGGAATVGVITVTETVPSGETLVSMSGTGWTCPGSRANNCTRSDVLASGSSYPAITVTVNVAADATSPQVNSIQVSGGASAVSTNTDSTVIDAP
jgi:hypothetical protein